MTITTSAELTSAVENWIADTTIAARVAEFIALGEEDIWRDVRCRAMEAMVDLRLQAAVDAGTAGGSADALTSTVASISSLTYGTTVTIAAAANNTGAATFNLNAGGAVAIRKGDGTEALEARDLLLGFDYTLYYDGTVWRVVPRGGVPLPSRYLAMRRIHLDTDPTRPLEFLPTDQFWSKNAAVQTSKPKFFTIDSDFIVFGPAPDTTYAGKALYYRRPTAITSAVPRLFSDGNSGMWLYSALKHAAPYLANDPRALTWAVLYESIVDGIHAADKKDRYGAPPLQSRGVAGP